jgi:hypothetical protein
MTDILLFAIAGLLIVVIVVLFVLLGKTSKTDTAGLILAEIRMKGLKLVDDEGSLYSAFYAGPSNHFYVF